MKKSLRLLFYVLLAFSLLPGLSCAEAEKKAPVPARNIENYTFPPQGNIEDRVFTTPQFLIDYYTDIDKSLIPADKPYKAYKPTESEMAEIKTVIRQLPKQYKDKVSPRLLGIYFIENLIGSGWSEWMPGKDGKRYYYMLFNSKVLKMGASEWITGKEKSALIMDKPGYDLEIDIGGGMSGFYYIFYHEFSHVFVYIVGVTPGEPGSDKASQFVVMANSPSMRKKYPFISGVWQQYTVPVKEYNFPGRENVTFYGLSGGPKIKISEASGYYEKLRSTPFVTLYGSQSWMEDYAEFIAAYMNVEVMKRPWVLRIKKDGIVIYEMNGVFDRKLIDFRMKFAEGLLK
jgi:hypothetical protein